MLRGPVFALLVLVGASVRCLAQTPVISAVNPSAYVAGSGGFPIIVYGKGFTSHTYVTVNGNSRPTSYVSATELKSELTAQDTQTSGAQIAVYVIETKMRSNVLTMGSGAITLIPLAFTPVLSSVSPTQARALDPPFSIAVTGANFTPQSRLRVGGTDRATVFVSATQLRGSIVPSDLLTSRTLQLTVFTPEPGGGTSATRDFFVAYPVPLITSLSPASIKGGSAGFTLTVNGAKFVPSTVVVWNDVARPTTYVSESKLTINVSAADIQKLSPPADRTATVSVFTQGGGRAGPLTFTITKQ